MCICIVAAAQGCRSMGHTLPLPLTMAPLCTPLPRYDGTVRNSAGDVVQFLYGEDGMDAVRIEGQVRRGQSGMNGAHTLWFFSVLFCRPTCSPPLHPPIPHDATATAVCVNQPCSSTAIITPPHTMSS
jgi:hypothetical protein